MDEKILKDIYNVLKSHEEKGLKKDEIDEYLKMLEILINDGFKNDANNPIVRRYLPEEYIQEIEESHEEVIREVDVINCIYCRRYFYVLKEAKTKEISCPYCKKKIGVDTNKSGTMIIKRMND